MRQNTGRRWSEATLGDEGDAFVASRRKNPCLLCQQQIKPRRGDRNSVGPSALFSCCILSRGSFSAALRKRLLRRRASCYALPLRRQRSSGSPHQARMAIGPSSKGLLRRLPVILPPLLGSSRWLFVIVRADTGVCPYTLGALILSSQSISPTYY